jgi:hypothetical protein
VDGEFSAGTAFVVRLQAGTASASPPAVLVTAHHLFGPDGGLPQSVSWKDLPTVVLSVRCLGLEPSMDVISAGHPFRVEEARPYSEKGAPRDVALFPLKAADSEYLLLSNDAVTSRRAVWLIAAVAGGEVATSLRHKARVLTSSVQWLEFKYENPNLDLTATSGAPIVDERGLVVGINIGARKGDGTLVGVAQSASVLREALKGALADAAAPETAVGGTPPRR